MFSKILISILSTLMFSQAFAASNAAMTEATFSCSGTEPFWSMLLTPENASFAFAGEEPEVLEPITKSISRNNSGDMRISTKNAAGEPVSGWVLNMTTYSATCNDGMSPFEYDYKVTLSVGNELISGCCHEVHFTLR